ncbi:MAG TPA: hypothetical protein VIT44_03365 [Cyclobacteriaceae bacterium]
MEANFKIKNIVEIAFKDKHIDLHNNFDLVGFNYELDSRLLTIEFKKSKGDWVPDSEFEKLLFTHHNVFFLNIGYDNETYEFPNDDKCIAGISFVNSSEREIDNEFSLQSDPLAEGDILFF